MKLCLIIFSIIFTSNKAVLYGQKFIVDTTRENEIRFFAEATFNNFQGITKSVDGYLILNDKNTTNNRFDFKVNLDSLDTGIGLRNRHMRNDLNTAEYPVAEFKGTSISIDSIGISEFKLKASGSFSVHGTTKNMAITGKFYNYGRLKKIESNFNLKLSDFKIERPSFLFNKLHSLIKLRVILYLIQQ